MMRLALALLATIGSTQIQAVAQSPAAAPGPGYVTVARLAESAPLVLHARVREAIPLPPERAGNVAPGMVRLYVEADVLALIRGRGGIGESIRYLVDAPLDARGKPPKLKKQEMLLFARQDAARPGEIQLIGDDAQLAYSPALDQRVRSILAAMLAADAPPVITGVREALHVRGNLEGEGETQFFLSTESGDPVSITVLRRPNMAPRWAVSLTEIVDEAAAPPKRETLLWYRLACFLPPQVPARALLSPREADNDLARRDYNFVLEALGPCTG